MKYIYVGIDCHKHIHTATIINCFNEKLGVITFNNDIQGYKNLIKEVESKKQNLEIIFGLEDVKHLGYGLAMYLISKNYLVKHINSNLTYAERKKFPIITKNDELDSQCVAKVLLDELDNLPFAQKDEIYWTLKQLVTMRASIVDNNVELKNKLHAQLLHHYPNYNKMFFRIYCKTALEMWKKYPSPDLLINTPIEEFTQFLNDVSNKRYKTHKANQIMDLVKQLDISNTEYQEERNIIIKTLVEQIQFNQKRQDEIEKEILTLYDKIGCTLHTYPGMSKLTSADILAEIGNINRFKDKGRLAKYAGVAPIEKSSGNTERALYNRFGNRQLNKYIYSLACRSISAGRNKDNPVNSIFLEYYHKKVNSGKTKHQALVCVMRRIINIIYVMLKNNTEYVHPQDLSNNCTQQFLKRLEDEKLKEEQRKLKKTKHKQNISS